MTDDPASTYALEASASEQSELDTLLVKLTTGALGFSVALGVLETKSGWLIASWFLFLPTIAAVLASKFIAIEALRNYYQARTHTNQETRAKRKAKAKKLDSRVNAHELRRGGALFRWCATSCHSYSG